MTDITLEIIENDIEITIEEPTEIEVEIGIYTQYTETDPIFSSWLGTVDPDEWDEAFSWGDHSQAGYLTSALATTTYIPLTQKGAANGVVPLDASGKIANSYLPALAITDTFVVADEAEMLLLDAETGDVAVRTDENKSYILLGTDPTELTDWQELLTPTNSVLSVNGQTGAVVLSTAEISDSTNKRYVTDSDLTLISNAIQIGGNISDLINDTGYLNAYPKVISRLTAEPVSPSTGDRHIILSPATGAEWPAHENEIAEWNGAFWAYTAVDGALVYVSSENKIYYYDENDDWLELTDTLGGGGGGGTWGSITGTLSTQTDLQTALDGKADLNGSNQPFTGDINISKASPRITVTETTDGATGYIEKLSTNNKLRFVSQNRLFLSGNGLTLNGSGNANRAAVSMGTNWSIDFWYKTSSTASQVIASGNTGADIHFWFSASNTVTVRGFSYTFATFTTTYADNLWHHWTVTSSSGGTITVYKDGVSLGSQTVGTTAHVLTNIGNYGVDSGHKCVGTIDQLVVWNKVLNGSEVSTRYNGGTGAEISDYTNVIAEYRFNSTYTDSSPNGYNMSAQGSGNTFSTGRVPSSVEPLTDLEYLSVYNDSINLSLGTIRLGTYSGSYASTNIYEGLSHTFSILGVSKFAFDGTNATLVGNTSITGTLTASGDVTTPLRFYAGTGSAAIPSFSFSSDSNTGMYRGSADQINFVTGGATRVELSNSTTRFQSGSVSVPGVGFVNYTNAGLYTNGVGVGISSGNYAAIFCTNATTTHSNTTSTIFQINGVTKVTISANGIGIGTSPTSLLHVLGTNAATVASFEQPSAGTSITTPFPAFELVNTNATANNFVTFSFADAVSGASYALLGGRCTDHTNNYGDFHIWTRGSSGGSTKLSVGENGGIIVTMPTDINLSGFTCIVPTTATTIGGTYAALSLVNTNTTNNNYARMDFLDVANGTSSAVIVCRFVNHTTKEGNLGIHVNNGGALIERIDMYTLETVVNESGGNIDFRVEGDTDENLIFADASANKVGFGTATPAYKVDAVGEINASIGYRVGGVAGASGTFTTTDLKTVTVTNGIITSII